MSQDQSESKWPSVEEQTQEALEKLGLGDVDWGRPITPEDIQYLLDHWPYLQMVSTGYVQALPEPEFITAKSGWVIHNYGDAMSSSPGELLIGGGDYRVLFDDDNAEDGLINPGKGTIWKQAFDTAVEMVALAKQLGWPGANVVDGHAGMKWAAWMQAMDEGFSLEGYEPSEKERKKRDRVKRPDVEDQLLLVDTLRPKQGG